MGKEIKKETGLLGAEKWVIYEDGVKVGETKKETGLFGDKFVTRNAYGEKVSETKRDGDKFVTRDTDGRKISETKYEDSQEVIYQEGKKIGELRREDGITDTIFGIKRKKLYETRGSDVDLTRRTSRTSVGHDAHETNYGSSGGYSGTSSTWVNAASVHKETPAWVKWFIGLLVFGLVIGLEIGLVIELGIKMGPLVFLYLMLPVIIVIAWPVGVILIAIILSDAKTLLGRLIKFLIWLVVLVTFTWPIGTVTLAIFNEALKSLH